MGVVVGRLQLGQVIPLDRQKGPADAARMAHLMRHLPRTHTPLPEADYRALIPLLAQPLTLADIARRLGWTLREVETRWGHVRSAVMPVMGNGNPGQVPRLALVRFLYGVDRCWCE